MATRIRGCRSSASTIGRYACRNAAWKTCGKFPTGWWLWIASERMRRLDMLLDPGDEPAGIEHAAGVELTLQFLHQRQRLWGRSPHVHCLLHCGRRSHEDRVPVILLRQRDQTREPRGHQAGVVERKPHRTCARVSDVPERTPPPTTVTAAGVSAEANNASISCAAWASDPRATMVPKVSGSGAILNVTSVMIPSVPSEPTKSLHMSYPATFLTTFPPALIGSPLARTIFIPMTRSRTPPYARRRGPLMLAATVPPIVDCRGSGGSIARNWRRAARRSCNEATHTPACTVAVRLASSCSTRRFRCSRLTTTSACVGGFPQCMAVPPPQGITAAPDSPQILSAAESWLGSCGAPRMCGTRPSTTCARSVAGSRCTGDPR